MVAQVGDEVRLPDGLRFSDLFDFERRRISGRVFSDPDIHRMELSRVFQRSWLFVGFESEIPNRGDFITRRMGGDSVIVTRDGNDLINIFLNRCAHRGVQLCLLDRGNGRRFRCPYHGWIYDETGRLEALVAQNDWLGPDGDKANYRIPEAQVATYAGLIFGNWDKTAPSFEESLGEFRWYFDILFRSTDKHLITTGPPQRWPVNFNWRLGAENFVGDGYHAPTAHGSVLTVNTAYGITGSDPPRGHGFFANAGRGYEVEPEITWLGWPGAKWLPLDVRGQFEQHLSPEQILTVRHGAPPLVGTLFPNFSWIASGEFFLVRTWTPLAFDRTELLTWALVHPDANQDLRQAADRNLNLAFGLTGMLEQDDMTLWPRTQRAYEGPMAQQQYQHYHCSREPNPKNALADGVDWPGPCEIRHGFASDDHLWNFHKRWFTLMTDA